jgi:hypothetical protein
LTIEEATVFVRRQWAIANALPDDHPVRADSLRTCLYRQAPLDTLKLETLKDLISECLQVTSLVQNEVLYPTETAWIKEYIRMAVVVLNLRRIQDGWATTTVEHRKRSAPTYVRRLLHLRTSPYVDHFPTLDTEIIHLLTEIKGWRTPSLVSYDEAVPPPHVPTKKEVKKRIPVSASTDSIEDALNKAVTDADTILYA